MINDLTLNEKSQMSDQGIDKSVPAMENIYIPPLEYNIDDKL